MRKFISLLLIVMCLLSTGCRSLVPLKGDAFIFGGAISYTFQIYSYSTDINNAFFNEIDKRIDEVNYVANTSNENSLLYKFNNEAEAGEAFKINKLMYDILLLCEEYYETTDGYFNPAILPLVVMWGVNKSSDIYNPNLPLPTEEEVTEALTYTDFKRDVAFYEDNGEYYLKKLTDSRTMLDFGGMAKGFLADESSKIAVEKGVSCGYFDVTGNILTLGQNKLAKRDWYFSVGTPDYDFTNGEDLATVRLNSQSLVVSGDYRRSKIVDGVQITHIINSKTGMPVGVYRTESGLTNVNPKTGKIDHVTSAAIIDENSARAEFFSTYVYALASDADNDIDLAKAAEILSKQNVKAIINTHDGRALIVGNILSVNQIRSNGLKYYTIPEELKTYGRLS